MLDRDSRLWAVYGDDVIDFIDAAEDSIASLRAMVVTLRGSTKGKTLRGLQNGYKQSVWDDRSHECEICGLPLTWATYELHHKISLANGGTFDDDNLMMLCANCHAECHALP